MRGGLTRAISTSVSVLSLVITMVISTITIFTSLRGPSDNILSFSLVSGAGFALMNVISTVKVILYMIFTVVTGIASGSTGGIGWRLVKCLQWGLYVETSNVTINSIFCCMGADVGQTCCRGRRRYSWI